MDLLVDPVDPTPPFEQIRRQLHDLVVTGVLGPGERLPALRQLAGDLGLAVGTVARAYRELEATGLLVSRRGGGTRVAPRVDWVFDRPDLAPVDRDLERLARGYLAQALALGATPDQARTALARVLEPGPAPSGEESGGRSPLPRPDPRATARRAPAAGSQAADTDPVRSLGSSS